MVKVTKGKYLIIPLLIVVFIIAYIFLTFNNAKKISNQSLKGGSAKLNDIRTKIDSAKQIVSENISNHLDVKRHVKKNVAVDSDGDGVVDAHYSVQEKNSLFDYNVQLLFTDNWKEKRELLHSLSSAQLYSLLKNQMTKLATLDNYTVITNFKNEYVDNEKLDFDLSELKLSDFGTMYLFDLFGDSCSHGDRVYDVVKQVLNDYKLDSVIDKIVIRPVNYFSNVDLGDSLFYDYYKTNIDRDYSGGKKNLIIDTNQLEKEDNETPTRYLEGIYTTAIDKKPDVISSSYKGICEFSYIEKSLADDNDYTNYLTAALNDSLDINKTKLKERLSGEGYSIIEPIASYFADSDEKGTIIVGNQVDTDRYEGMYSSSGTSITALGKGIRWGRVNCTKCIDFIKDVGTSFATPELATKLLIAKAWWRKHNDDCNAIEARRRLILATNLNDNFLGKFASAGNISLNKLLQTEKGYLVKNDNSVVAIDSIYTALISHGNALTRLRYSTNIDDISGLYVVNGKVVELKNRKSPKWEIIPEPTSIDLIVKRKSDQMIIPIEREGFLKEYKQFVILK